MVLPYNDLLFVYSDHNGLEIRGEREKYAHNTDELLKGQPKSSEHNKHIAAVADGSNIVSQVRATGQTAVTQLQIITCAEEPRPNSMQLNENIYYDNETDWLHRNDAYQMQRNSRRLIPTLMSLDENPQLSTIDNLHMPEKSSKKRVSCLIY